MIFRTESGSSYEINLGSKKIRRLSGALGPTERQGQDGAWKDFSTISTPTVGEPLIIVWSYKGTIAESTLTSPLVSLEAEN